jgi:hypothetical protein
MRKLLQRFTNPAPETMVKLHGGAMVVWLAVTPITLLNPDSVMWVSFMSQYANFVGHFASLDGARAEQTSKEELEKVQIELAEIKTLLQSKLGLDGGV